MKITQYAMSPFEETEIEQATPGFSIYLTMESGQRFRIDESPGGGLKISADSTGAKTSHLAVRPMYLNTVTVDVDK